LNGNWSSVGNSLYKSHFRTKSLEAEANKLEFYEAPRITHSSFRSTKKIGKCYGNNSLNVNGTIVGVDKIDHFFGNGGTIWSEVEKNKEKLINEGKGLDQAFIEYSTRQEHGWWGLYACGQKSFGDLAANWKGYLFWKNLIDGSDPYLKCKGEKLIQSKAFDIKKYVDPLWNEAINCSSFSTEEIGRSIKDNIYKDGNKCPMNPKICKDMVKKYKHVPKYISENIISPACRGELPFPVINTNIVKTPWKDVGQGLIGLKPAMFKKVIKNYLPGLDDRGTE